MPRASLHRPERARRPRHLLSGLLRCGTCGGGFSKISRAHYGCSTARNKGTCDNFRTIRRDDLETRVLDGLARHLMHPDLVKTFIEEFHREVNRQAATRDMRRHQLDHDRKKTARDIGSVIEAIKAGVTGASVRDEMARLEARKAGLVAEIEQSPKSLPRLHPNLAGVYRRKVANLAEARDADDTRAEAFEAIRRLVEDVRLVPHENDLKIELYGELAALLILGNENPRSTEAGVNGGGRETEFQHSLAELRFVTQVHAKFVQKRKSQRRPPEMLRAAMTAPRPPPSDHLPGLGGASTVATVEARFQ